jgi:hypothetical protein
MNEVCGQDFANAQPAGLVRILAVSLKYRVIVEKEETPVKSAAFVFCEELNGVNPDQRLAYIDLIPLREGAVG